MEVVEEEDKRVVPSERLANEEPGALPPPAPDGGIPPMPLDLPPPIPPASPEEFVCLRGPCRHYIELESLAEVEVKIEGYQPVQKNRYCRVIPGVYLDLTEDSVFGCNRWDPEESDAGLAQRRKNYLDLHPNCGKADAARIQKKQQLLQELAEAADAREAADAAAKAAKE